MADSKKASDGKKHEKHQKVEKKNYMWLWIVLGIVVIVIVSGVIFTGRIGTFVQSPSYSNQPKCRDIQVAYEAQEEYMKTEYYTETVPYTDRECESKRLVYKKETGTCQDRQSGLFGLGDQPAKYSCTITNLDNEGGTFSMRIGFNVGNQQLETTQSKYIYPQSSATFSYEVDATIDSCYCSEQVPTKQVCRDVIKYREIQKQRQVTAYKPVTKYRTEQRCN